MNSGLGAHPVFIGSKWGEASENPVLSLIRRFKIQGIGWQPFQAPLCLCQIGVWNGSSAGPPRSLDLS